MKPLQIVPFDFPAFMADPVNGELFALVEKHPEIQEALMQVAFERFARIVKDHTARSSIGGVKCPGPM